MTKRTTKINLDSFKFDKKLVISGISILVVQMIYRVLTMKNLLLEGRPNFSLNSIVESFIIFLGLLLFFKGIVNERKTRTRIFFNENKRFEIFSTYLATLFSLIFVLLFILDPKLFSEYSLEDNIIEWLSTLFLFGCSFVFLLTSYRYKKSLGRMNLWIIYFLAIVFFILAMEEISWFQRVLEIETPKDSVFKYNNQYELNLHNFATNYVENLYYTGSFLVLVFLPFAGFIYRDVLHKFQISIFIPKPFLAVIGALFCAYNYDMWNIIFIQYTFFSALIILFYYITICRHSWERSIILFIFIIVVLSQTCFLYFGENFDRLWEITEYKEFLIPLTFLIYALELCINVANNRENNLFSNS